MLHWVIPSYILQSKSPYLMDFLEIFTSGRYHRDMKALKILASNFKWFRVYGIFKKLQIDGIFKKLQINDDKWGPPNTTIS